MAWTARKLLADGADLGSVKLFQRLTCHPVHVGPADRVQPLVAILAEQGVSKPVARQGLPPRLEPDQAAALYEAVLRAGDVAEHSQRLATLHPGHVRCCPAANSSPSMQAAASRVCASAGNRPNTGMAQGMRRSGEQSVTIWRLLAGIR